MEKLVLFQFKFKFLTVQLPVLLEHVFNVLMVTIQKMEVVFQCQFFVEENTINKQVNVQDVLMVISFKEENVFIQLLELMQLVKNTLQVDFAISVHWVTTFLTTNVLKSTISVQSLITQDQFVHNVTTRFLKEQDVFEIRHY